jgi:hypothetical protein
MRVEARRYHSSPSELDIVQYYVTVKHELFL